MYVYEFKIIAKHESHKNFLSANAYAIYFCMFLLIHQICYGLKYKYLWYNIMPVHNMARCLNELESQLLFFVRSYKNYFSYLHFAYKNIKYLKSICIPTRKSSLLLQSV